MSLLPRLLCEDGSSNKIDCFEKPALPLLSTKEVQIDVDWSTENWWNDNAIIIPNFRPSHLKDVCDAPTVRFLNRGDYFTINDCNIDQGNLKGTFKRNAFNCLASDEVSTYIDMYSKGEKVYLVSQTTNSGDGSLNFHVDIYTAGGLSQNKVAIEFLPSTAAYKSVAVDPTGNIYLLIAPDSSAAPRKFYRIGLDTSSGTYNPAVDTFMAGIDSTEHIEIAENNLGFITDISKNIKVFNPATPLLTGDSVAVPWTIKRILYRDSKLFILSNDGTDSKVQLGTYSTSLLIDPSPTFPVSGTYTNLTLSQLGTTKYMILQSNSAAPSVLLDLSAPTPQVHSLNSGTNTSHSIAFADRIYSLESGNFSSYRLNLLSSPSLSTITRVISNMCSETISANIEGKPQELTLSTYKDSTVKRLFDDAFRFIGLRELNSNNAFTYFESLQDDHESGYSRASGQLSRAIEMLSPNGLGGIVSGFFPGKSCTELRDLLPLTAPGIGKTFLLNDSIKAEQRTYNLTLSRATAPYSLSLFIHSASPSPEQMKILIDCSSKAGRLESFDEESAGEPRRELLVWNTSNPSSQLYENYEIEKTSEEQRFVMTGFKMDASREIHLRNLDLTLRSSNTSGRITEFRGNGNYFASFNEMISYSAVNDFINDTLYSDSSLSANMNHCMLVTATNPRTASIPAPDALCSAAPAVTLPSPTVGAGWVYSLEGIHSRSSPTPGTVSDFEKIFSLK